MIDLRSDTVTLPPPEMRRAMYEAELGDDVFGDDPTVNRLQEHAAALLGAEAALFVPSGTMGNLVGVMTHCQRGNEAVMGDQAHVFYYEGGGSAVLGSVNLRTVPTATDGTLALADLRAAIRPRTDIHQPLTALLCLENTHNRRGGAVLPLSYMAEVRALADEHNLPIHLDGARLFNAAVAQGIPARAMVELVDSASICLSKGLSAPVGSLLVGKREYISEARRWRKMVGGGMRQAGVLAAAGLYALDHMVDRLADDHANATLLAKGLQEMKGLCLAQAAVQTNIVVVDIAATGLSVPQFLANLASAGVLAVAFGSTLVRFVTHYGIERPMIEEALRLVSSAINKA